MKAFDYLNLPRQALKDRGSTYGQLPHPNNSQVTLRELGTETCVAKSFRGRATDELSRKVSEALRASAATYRVPVDLLQS